LYTANKKTQKTFFRSKAGKILCLYKKRPHKSRDLEHSDGNKNIFQVAAEIAKSSHKVLAKNCVKDCRKQTVTQYRIKQNVHGKLLDEEYISDR